MALLSRLFWPVCGTKGKPCKPDATLDLPDWPDPQKIAEVPFFRPVDPVDGSPVEWMRAGSLIDGKSGVYLILDLEGDSIYVGSSIGVSESANVRRTLARHWQQWKRSRWGIKTRGTADPGVVVPRRDVAVAVFLVPLDLEVPEDAQMKTANGKPVRSTYALAPRQIESWLQREVKQRFNLIGEARLIEYDSPDTPF